MERMSKIKLISAFLLGGILFSGITVYAAYKIHANDVSFHPENENFQAENVNSALDSLYEKIEDNKLKLLTTVNGEENKLNYKYSDSATYIATESGKLLFVADVHASGYLGTGRTESVTSNNPDSEIIKMGCSYNYATAEDCGSYSHLCLYIINNVSQGDKITWAASAPINSAAAKHNSLNVGYQVYKIG